VGVTDRPDPVVFDGMELRLAFACFGRANATWDELYAAEASGDTEAAEAMRGTACRQIQRDLVASKAALLDLLDKLRPQLAARGLL
jgi:hypothetical protein